MTWLRKRKRFSKPRKKFDKARIEEENGLIKRYGLKSKREIWKADAAIARIRKQAKKLITAGQEEQGKLIEKLNKSGFNAKTIADVLGLSKEDWLKRRLQSILIEKNLAKPKEARQLIAHKHIRIEGKVVNIPGYIVRVEEENKIEVRKKAKSLKKEEAKEEKAEIKEGTKQEEKK